MADETEEAQEPQPEAAAAPTPSTRPRRRWLVVILVVLGSIVAFLSIFALWANRQFLNTENWTQTSSELLQKDAVREQVSGFIVDQIYANVDVQGQLSQALPPQAKPLAGPAAGALRNAAETGINELLKRPKVQQLWEAANRLAHQKLLLVIEGGGKNVSTEGGNVTLDLGQMIRTLGTTIGLGSVASQIPADAGKITVLKSDNLKSVQNGLKALRGGTVIFLVLMLLLFVAAVAFAGRRREALRMVGWGLIVAGVLALITRSVVGDQIVDSLASTASVKPAVSDVWEVSTSLLIEAAQSTVAYGVVIVLGAWLAGGTQWAGATRKGMAPFLSDPRWAYGGLGVIVLLILIWGPTPATRKPLPMLLFIVLLAIGLEALRRQAAREYPDASIDDVGRARRSGLSSARQTVAAGGHAVTQRVGRLTAGRGGTGSDATTTETPAAQDTKLERLERLAKLHESGVLDDAEFKAEKAKVLAESST